MSSCGECGAFMSLESDYFNGQDILVCRDCGCMEAATDNLKESITTSCPFSHTGEGAVPSGYKYEKNRISKTRKKSIESIERLCNNFGISSILKKEMLNIFGKFQGRYLDAGAGASFLTVVRNDQSQQDDGELITLRQVASFLDVPLGKLSAAMKSVQKLVNHQVVNKPTSGAMTNVPGLLRSIFSDCHFLDPFTNSDATARVLDVAEKIIQLVQSRSSQHWDPNFTAMAAGCLAWQSCFFYQPAHLGHLATESLKLPTKMGSVKEFLVHSRLLINDAVLNSVHRSLLRLSRVLMEHLNKMAWIEAFKGPPKKVIPQFLDQILEHQKLTGEVLSAEEEMKRREQMLREPPPIIPRELSAAEEAELNSPELTEKDLAEEDLIKYIRTPQEVKEVEALMRRINSSANQPHKTLHTDSGTRV